MKPSVKLIQKTTQYYLGLTLFILTLGTVFFYFLIRAVLIDSVDEALYQEEVQIVKNLQYEVIIDSLQPSPNVKIRKTDLQKAYPEKFSIVKLYSEEEGDFVDFRQVKKIIKHGNNYYELIIRQSLQEAETLLFSLIPVVMGLFLFILIGVLLINGLVAQRVWTPFYELLDKVKEYDLVSSKVIEHRHSDIKEFNELSLNVDKMTTKIYQDFINQKEFNENSSHEMQTPLAIIRHKLDLLIQSKNLKESELQLIEGIYEGQKRLTMLNKGLLLISKIDNHQFKEGEEVEMEEVVRKTVEHYMPQLEEKEVALTMNIHNNPIVKFNKALADILLSNLVSNAIKHNIRGGHIIIELTTDFLKVENTGKILDVKPESLFERFKKNSDSENSIGLGLAIVKKITDLFHFGVKYESSHDIHTMLIEFNPQGAN